MVMLIGMNDRQQMRVETRRVAKLSEPWKAEYDRRVDAAVKPLRDTQRAADLAWPAAGQIGHDEHRFACVQRDLPRQVEAAGGRFVDVWDGFANAEGQFVTPAPTSTASSCGCALPTASTSPRAGMRKLAFYASRTAQEDRPRRRDGHRIPVARGARGAETKYDPARRAARSSSASTARRPMAAACWKAPKASLTIRRRTPA